LPGDHYQEASLHSVRSSPARPAPLWPLAIVCLVLVTHGSVYPWHFERPAWLGGALRQLFEATHLWTGLGDVTGNIVLFMPVGVLGKLLLVRSRMRPALHVPMLLAFGVPFALALQIVQIFVPSRDAAISDLLWNTIGLLVGLALASMVVPATPRLARLAGPLTCPAAAMVGLWLAIELWPFVPTIDWQHVKDALKPLLLERRWSAISTIEATLSVVVAGHFLRTARLRVALFAGILVLAGFSKLFVSGQEISLSHAMGYAIGAALAALSWRFPQRQVVSTLIFVALAWFTADELRPYTLADYAGTFHWIPFVAMLVGSLTANALALLWNLFWLGAVMVLAADVGARLMPFGLAITVWVLALELAQTWLPGRVADITPALMPAFWIMLLQVVQPPPEREGLPAR
jgi:VanZ family protein